MKSLQSRPLCVYSFLFSFHHPWLGHAGKIIQDIIKEGYTITDLELFHLDRSNAEEFLEVYKGIVPEYHVSFVGVSGAYH